MTLQKNVCVAVENCFVFVTIRTLFISRQLLAANRKVALPATKLSSMNISAGVTCDTKNTPTTSRSDQAACLEMATTPHRLPVSPDGQSTEAKTTHSRL